MAWFKSSNTAKEKPRFRSKQNEQNLVQKKRARRRLIGAVILALATAIGLPMVLDKEPKPLSNNLSIVIPSADTPFTPSSEDTTQTKTKHKNAQTPESTPSHNKH